mgnify:FL=1
MRRLADELDADAVQEQVELLEVQRAVAVVVDVLDEVVDLRYGLSRRYNATTRDRSKKGGSYGNGWRFGWSLIRCVSKVVN